MAGSVDSPLAQAFANEVPSCVPAMTGSSVCQVWELVARSTKPGFTGSPDGPFSGGRPLRLRRWFQKLRKRRAPLQMKLVADLQWGAYVSMKSAAIARVTSAIPAAGDRTSDNHCAKIRPGHLSLSQYAPVWGALRSQSARVRPPVSHSALQSPAVQLLPSPFPRNQCRETGRYHG